MNKNADVDIVLITRKEANKLGLKRYYTGKPCKHGHIEERTTSNGVCMECSRIKTRKFWDENPEAKKKNQAEGRLLSKEKYISDANFRRAAKARASEWYRANSDRAKSTKAEWYSKNRESAKAACRARWAKYRSDPVWVEKERSRKRQEMRDHPERAVASDNARRARMKNAEGKVTAADINRILKSQSSKCVYCKASLKDGYEVDHIIPISKGGSNWPTNIQCLCRNCNRTKSAKCPIAFANEKGMLL